MRHPANAERCTFCGCLNRNIRYPGFGIWIVRCSNPTCERAWPRWKD
jgi:hypothetical protein